jgi:GTPase SAR1 family protein
LGPENCPKILVGLKADLRDEYQELFSKRDEYVKEEEVKKLREQFGFNFYVECSAKTRSGLNEVFFKGVQSHSQAKQKLNQVNSVPRVQSTNNS